MKPDSPTKLSPKIKFQSLVKVDIYLNVYSSLQIFHFGAENCALLLQCDQPCYLLHYSDECGAIHTKPLVNKAI